MGTRYVCFTIGKGRYGVPVDDVVQIIRYEEAAEVPTAAPFVEGALNLQGDVIPVINVRKRFGLSELENTRKTRVLVVGREGKNYGLLVDGVRGILDLSEENIVTESTRPKRSDETTRQKLSDETTRQKLSDETTSVLGMNTDFILGIAKVNESLLIILDIFKILSSSSEISVTE